MKMPRVVVVEVEELQLGRQLVLAPPWEVLLSMEAQRHYYYCYH